MTTTLRDLLHSMNVLGQAGDIFVEGMDAVPVVPPIKFNPVGRLEFGRALQAKVEVDYRDDHFCGCYVCRDDRGLDEEAWILLTWLAGYNDDSHRVEKWFGGDDAQMI